MDNRKKEIIEMRNIGKTYQEIGNIFNISRQRIHQIITGHKNKNKKEYYKKKRIEHRINVLSHYGGKNPKCNMCKFSNVDCLTLDHINNDGATHRKEVKGNDFYKWVIHNNYPKSFQILCRNCNWLKYINFKKESVEKGILTLIFGE